METRPRKSKEELAKEQEQKTERARERYVCNALPWVAQLRKLHGDAQAFVNAHGGSPSMQEDRSAMIGVVDQLGAIYARAVREAKV